MSRNLPSQIPTDLVKQIIMEQRGSFLASLEEVIRLADNGEIELRPGIEDLQKRLQHSISNAILDEALG